jgi:peptide/nickel transport system substrate-binding protein
MVRRTDASRICLVIAVVAAGATGACDSSGGSAGGQGSAATTISIGIDSDPVPFGYDPAAVSGGGATTFFQAFYGSLFATSSTGKVEPQLASGYQFNTDKTELTLTLRQNVTFTDGTTLTASLVKANLDRRSPALGAYGMFAKGGAAEIRNVSASDPSTVVITFAQPQASATSLLADDGGRIVGGKAAADPKILQTGPDGSGPYTLSAGGTVKGSTYTLVKNDDAWNASSYPYSKIVFKVLTDPQARANALASGQVQIAQLDPTTVSFAKSKASVVEFSGAIYGFSLFDKLGKVAKPFASVGVRQALSMALDRTKIAALHPNATATASYFPPGTDGYEVGLETTYAYNPAKAKQLLAEAGYPDGFSFTLLTAGMGNDAELQSAQRDWQAIGVTMNIKHVTSYAELLRAQTTTPLGYSGFTFGHDPLSWVYNFLLGGTFNAQHAEDPQIQSALREVAAGGGNADVAGLRKLNAAIVDQGWSIPLYVQPIYLGYNPSQVAAPQGSWDNVYPLLSSIVPAGQTP